VIPLLKERLEVIHESGQILLDKFNGSFYECIIQCERSAQNLVKIIVENFPSFRDFSVFRGKGVSFLKRAQILVADIHNCFQTSDDLICQFTDIGSLTMFADYRVPQTLAFLGALRYTPELVDRLRSNELVENGSELEVMIRGYSIFVCDKITEQISQMKTKSRSTVKRELWAVDVDVFLWTFRRHNAEKIEMAVPFHRCRCIYY